MKAEIISTGTELLLGKTLNTSAFYLTGQLSGLGIEVDYHITVGDNKERLIGAVQQAVARSQMVVLTGGLGPTADDLTKEIIAVALGINLDLDRDSKHALENFYDHKSTLPPGSEKQAFFPHGAKVLPNDYGTAPGAIIEKDTKVCVILPGPPSEMKPMFEHYALPELQRIMQHDTQRMHVRILKVFGLGESELEQKLPDLMKQTDPFLTLMDKHTSIDLRVTIKDSDNERALQVLNDTEAVIRKRLGNRIFGVDDETHSQIVGNLLKKSNLTLSTAESCTGGLLGGRITAEAGSSDYYLGGVVSYANTAKEALLGVQEESLIKYGAVSEAVAKGMALGVRKKFNTDLGLSITGIAGPGGGTKEKPVGLVYIGLAYRDIVRAEEHQYVGNRESIRNMTVESALNMLRLTLIAES